MRRVRRLRLTSSSVCVDVRLVQIQGRWIASVDTPDGPTLGLGRLPYEAVLYALQPFEGVVEELMETLPDELYWPAG